MRLSKGFPSVSLLRCQTEMSRSSLKAEKELCQTRERAKKKKRGLKFLGI